MKEAAFKITLSCADVPEKEGLAGAACIEEEFSHRTWHRNVTCAWEGGRLILHGENDFDSDGQALVHEFLDAICACLPVGVKVDIKVVSVVRSEGNSEE
jgi:hypothetical protein